MYRRMTLMKHAFILLLSTSGVLGFSLYGGPAAAAVPRAPRSAPTMSSFAPLDLPLPPRVKSDLQRPQEHQHLGTALQREGVEDLVSRGSRAYMTRLEEQPILTKGITTFTLSFCGNVLAQLVCQQMGDEVAPLSVDCCQALLYGLVGGVYTAPLVHGWFNVLNKVVPETRDAVTGEPKKMTRAVKMVAVDQLLGACVINAGFIFLFTALVSGAGGNDFSGSTVLALHKTEDTLLPTTLLGWKLWPLAQLFNFTVTPRHLQTVFVSCVNLFWSVAVSVMLSSGSMVA